MARLWRFTVSLARSKQPIASDPYNMDKIKHYPCQWEYTNYSIRYWLIPVITLIVWLGQQLQLDHYLIKFMMVYSESPRSIPLLHAPNRQIKWVCITYHPLCIFKILDSGTNFCKSSKVVVLLLVYLLSSFSWAIVMSWIPRIIVNSEPMSIVNSEPIPVNSEHLLVLVYRHSINVFQLLWKSLERIL